MGNILLFQTNLYRSKIFSQYLLDDMEEVLILSTILTEDMTIHAMTAHHLMEFLNVFLKFDPKLILHLATLTVKASQATGYPVDTFAIREVVKLVEIILADYRKEVQDSKVLEDLLDLLDIFCKVGWPEAIRLVWRLDEIFR